MCRLFYYFSSIHIGTTLIRYGTLWCTLAPKVAQDYKAIVDGRLHPGAQFTMSTSGFYCWAKFDWNLGCYACRVLSAPRNAHSAPKGSYVKIRRYPQNRNAVRGRPKYGHKQRAQKFGDVRPCGFRVMRADRQTNVLVTMLRAPSKAK